MGSTLFFIISISRYTGLEKKCLNLGSYNYLGFAEASGPCAEESIESIKKYACSLCSTRQELGMFLTESPHICVKSYLFNHNTVT